MELQRTNIPPVSIKLYTRLLEVFPPIDHRSITKHTDMIDVQRNAAQQEVIEFLRDNVVPDGNIATINTTSKTITDKIKNLFSRR